MQIVPYYRVSTQRQGESGLGLEAQVSAVERYASSIGADILPGEVEIESGRRADRPKLAEALARCRSTGATLAIAKLDRLARNVAFIARLLEADVPILACDNPHANRLTLHILAAVAEEEARAISARTVAALAARRARGLPLGGQIPSIAANLDDTARRRSLAIRRAKQLDKLRILCPKIASLRSAGRKLSDIANDLGLSASQVNRAIANSHKLGLPNLKIS
jgi:DNA invertase Pin-like site-specific DNA recombinase